MRPSLASFPAKRPETKRPKKDATAAEIGGRASALKSARTTARATPARIAGQRSGGIARFESMTRLYGEHRVKRNRSARPTRIGGFAKGARSELTSATIARCAQHLLLLALLGLLCSLLLRRH